MKAAVLHGAADLRYETVADPAPAANEVIVEVHACSICGSDLHGFYGKHPWLVFPRILGHEFAGEVVALGSGVEGVPICQRVCCDIDINFSRGNFQAFAPCLDLVAKRAVDPDLYISHRLPLAHAADALHLLEARSVEAHKIALHPQEAA